MKYFQHKFWALMSVAVLLFGTTSCQDEGYEDVSGTASQTLWEVISSRQELSQFATILRQNGFDQVLNSSGNYTVFAPGNGQLSIVAPDKMNEVPGAHIAPLSYNKLTLDGMSYITMYNGRQALLSDFSLSGEEIVCRNGFLRFAQGAARATQENLYESLLKLSSEYEMAAFITSLGDSIMDTERSVQVGIDPVTNQPVYDTVMIFHNPLFEHVPYNDNDSLISLLLLDNENWNALVKKYSRYMRQHVDISSNPDQLSDPTKDANLPYGSKIDSVATDSATKVELIRDLAFSYDGATARPSINNVDCVNNVYLSRSGIEVNMDNAVITDTVLAANGRIEIAKGVKIKLANNKIKDVYVEAEDYYYTNETYVATLIDPRFRGSRYVKTYGVDSLRSYTRYVLDSVGQRQKDESGKYVTEYVRYIPSPKDSEKAIAQTYSNMLLRYVYNTTQYSGQYGGSVLGYKVNLYSCNYRIQWRHVVPGNQATPYADVDTLDVNYPVYRHYADSLRALGRSDSLNWPIGGVVRHIQKMYLSQPGDAPLEYNKDLSTKDFVLHPYPYNSFTSKTYFRCMTDYDPAARISSKAAEDEVSKNAKFRRMGINAGVGVDDPNFETPLVWCETSKDHPKGQLLDEFGNVKTDVAVCSGIVSVSSDTTWRYKSNDITKAPIIVPRDIFMCLYNGEATVFVTSNPFGTTGTAAAANLSNMKGSIFLDYIHFIPVIDEDD